MRRISPDCFDQDDPAKTLACTQGPHDYTLTPGRGGRVDALPAWKKRKLRGGTIVRHNTSTVGIARARRRFYRLPSKARSKMTAYLIAIDTTASQLNICVDSYPKDRVWLVNLKSCYRSPMQFSVSCTASLVLSSHS